MIGTPLKGDASPSVHETVLCLDSIPIASIGVRLKRWPACCPPPPSAEAMMPRFPKKPTPIMAGPGLVGNPPGNARPAPPAADAGSVAGGGQKRRSGYTRTVSDHVRKKKKEAEGEGDRGERDDPKRSFDDGYGDALKGQTQTVADDEEEETPFKETVRGPKGQHIERFTFTLVHGSGNKKAFKITSDKFRMKMALAKSEIKVCKCHVCKHIS